MVHVVHEITSEHGDCGWVIKNIDASNNGNVLFQKEFNQVVTGILGRGYTLDAVAVVFKRIDPTDSGEFNFPPLFFNILVKQQLASRSPDQSVQDIQEPRRRAQLAQHDRIPKPHSVTIVSAPLNAFSTFVTLTVFRCLSQAQSLVVTTQQQLVSPSRCERERAMGFLGGMC
jgi:hypothetical protein